jgi:L-fucose dehydrogenase
MNLGLENKVIIVSGSITETGREIIKLLAEEGAVPVIIGFDKEANLKTVDEIVASGGKCLQFVADLTNADACKDAIEAVLKTFNKIDGLINNIVTSKHFKLQSGEYENFITTLNKDLASYFVLTHCVLPSLKTSAGPIVNITYKLAGTAEYTTANGGAIALTREWAVELLKYNIRVNAVVMEEAQTSLYESEPNSLLHAEQKRNTPFVTSLENEIIAINKTANTVAFLLSEKSSHTTGQIIHVNGGYYD